MTAQDIAELKRLAQLASPGPWRGDRYDGTVKYALLDADGNEVIQGDNGNTGLGPYGIMNDHDERYLIAANPVSILAIIADIAKLESVNADYVHLLSVQKTLLESRDRKIAELEAAATINERYFAQVVKVCVLTCEAKRIRDAKITRDVVAYNDGVSACIKAISEMFPLSTDSKSMTKRLDIQRGEK